jgi:hypothetical protein
MAPPQLETIMFSKIEYLEELRLQLAYVDNIEEYEEIMETIREVEDGMLADSEAEY